jgi:hypothetical protein
MLINIDPTALKVLFGCTVLVVALYTGRPFIFKWRDLIFKSPKI